MIHVKQPLVQSDQKYWSVGDHYRQVPLCNLGWVHSHGHKSITDQITYSEPSSYSQGEVTPIDSLVWTVTTAQLLSGSFKQIHHWPPVCDIQDFDRWLCCIPAIDCWLHTNSAVNEERVVTPSLPQYTGSRCAVAAMTKMYIGVTSMGVSWVTDFSPYLLSLDLYRPYW